MIAQQQESSATKEAQQPPIPGTEELIAFCPKCKTLETLWFTRGALVQTRKFAQKDARVYHDCGSNEPCRLLPSFLNEGWLPEFIYYVTGAELAIPVLVSMEILESIGELIDGNEQVES